MLRIRILRTGSGKSEGKKMLLPAYPPTTALGQKFGLADRRRASGGAGAALPGGAVPAF